MFGKMLKANLNLNLPSFYSFITYRALLKGQKVQSPTMVKVEVSENVKGSKNTIENTSTIDNASAIDNASTIDNTSTIDNIPISDKTSD